VFQKYLRCIPLAAKGLEIRGRRRWRIKIVNI